MSKRNVLLAYSIVMFILTTLLVVCIPLAVQHSLDTQQKFIVLMLGLLGYFAAGITFYGYVEDVRD